MKHVIRAVIVLLLSPVAMGAANSPLSATQSRMFEWTFESRKAYPDPFNDVDVDVIFSKDGESWRVPTFWRGGSKWTVRFAPPSPGEYTYHLESTDQRNPDLNGRGGRVTITAYAGTNALLRHGMLRVSANKRYFEHADGTPFYWLGDTWWTGMSDRLSWEGFQKLTADRKAKGFTVVQIVAGLVPGEEKPPADPGFCNEGGCVWDATLTRINPRYFDYADRRIKHLVDSEITLALVGGWQNVASEMRANKLTKHWRYLIARYGAYPVFWIVGGEIFQPLANDEKNAGFIEALDLKVKGDIWAEVARYIRRTDPYHHPITTHEFPPPIHGGLVEASLTDFDLPQPGQFGWASLATEVAQLTALYARAPTKPVVQGEVAYEQLGAENFQDSQRAAFWLAMLNGAAGHSYGTIEIAEAYAADKPLHRTRWSLSTWEEAMNFPGSTQVALNAKFLRKFPWYRFAPHPEWVTPRGTTLFEPNNSIREIDLDLMYAHSAALQTSARPLENEVPTGEWKYRQGTFRQPYAAGVPREVRMIYIPYFGVITPGSPTVLGLESGIRYHAYYWDPMLGIKVDLGTVERPQPGRVVFKDTRKNRQAADWTWEKPLDGDPNAGEQFVSLVRGVSEVNGAARVETTLNAEAALIFRYHDENSYIAANYSAAEKAIFLTYRVAGKERAQLGKTTLPRLGDAIRLSAELRDSYGIVSVTDGRNTVTSPIVSLDSRRPAAVSSAGRVGVMHRSKSLGALGDFEFCASPRLVDDKNLERKLYDANGVFRGEMSGSAEWDQYGRSKIILLDAYRPERVPFRQDWVLVLDAQK
ncbi:MAG: DUF4038 domain-containing protein [Acidobacteria bacterium]|nr:DUF4038 domain-containing protein [Acidobacteriota bacterium]